MTQTKTRRRYTVRKQSSGRSFSETFYVFDNVTKSRVSVHATVSRRTAQMEADGLEAGAMVRDYADDPRPYAERRAEAEARVAAGEGSR